jgi:hypothetical protein
MFADRRQDRLQRGFGGVIPQSKTARGDTPDRFHVRGLDAEHRGAGQRQIVDMGKMPIIGRTIVGRILAHRRHDDAIGEFEAAQLDRREQGTHAGFPGKMVDRFM